MPVFKRSAKTQRRQRNQEPRLVAKPAEIEYPAAKLVTLQPDERGI